MGAVSKTSRGWAGTALELDQELLSACLSLRGIEEGLWTRTCVGGYYQEAQEERGADPRVMIMSGNLLHSLKNFFSSLRTILIFVSFSTSGVK